MENNPNQMDGFAAAINTAANAALADLVQGGKLAEIVQATATKAVTDVVENALRSYGDFGKQLKEALQEALAVDVRALGLGGYNQIVLGILRQRLDEAIMTVGAETLKRDMEDLLAGPMAAEMTLSVLVKEFGKWHRDESRFDHASGTPTLIVEKTDYGSYWVYFDRKPDASPYNTAFRLGMDGKDGRVWSAQIGSLKAENGVFAARSLSGFPRLMFQLYACRTRLIITPDEIDKAHSLLSSVEDWGDEEEV